MSTAAQLAANQQNAQLSTGPRTAEGKAISSQNALKTGLTGRTVLLAGEDPALYQAHCESFFAEYQPANDAETELVQAIADTAWRLHRIPQLEAGIFNLGHLQLKDQFAQLYPDTDPAARNQLIRAQVYITYTRQLSNLALQENRLQRRFYKLLDELQERQTMRKQLEQMTLEEAARLYLEAQKSNQPFDPTEFGFEFSITQIEDFLTRPQPHPQRHNLTRAA